MEREIRARFVNGKVELLEESDLREGEEVWVVVPLRRKRERAAKVVHSPSNDEGEDETRHWDDLLNTLYERRRQAYLKSESLDV